MIEHPNELGLPEWESEGGSLGFDPALSLRRAKKTGAGARHRMITIRIGALVGLLCVATIGWLWLRLSFGTLLTGAACLFVFAMLRELWLGERAHRSAEREREAHLSREREFASARLREWGSDS